MVTDGTDNADHAGRLRPTEMACRAVGVTVSNLLQGGQGAEIGKNLIGAKVKPMNSIKRI